MEPLRKTGLDNFRDGREEKESPPNSVHLHSESPAVPGIPLKMVGPCPIQTVLPETPESAEKNRYFFWKRVFDLSLSIPLFICFLPIMAVIALAVRLDSPGPIIFRQIRIGEDRRWDHPTLESKSSRKENRLGKQFVFYKFRTMYADARERFPEYYRYQYTKKDFVNMGNKERIIGGIANGTDPRLTPLGAWLRKTSLDELPNLINTIKGDISVIGPRPSYYELIRHLPEEFYVIFRTKPGLSCLAQVKGRGQLTFAEVAEWDLEYIRNQSISLDMKIFFMTIKSVLFGKGAF